MILAFTSMVALVFGGWVAVAAMDHTERLAMIRRGIVPPPEPRVLLPPAVALRYLQGTLVLGCALFVIMISAAYLVYPLP